MLMCNLSNHKGLTLIELLIVLIISSFIVSGLFTVYLQMKEHHIKNNALQEISDQVGFINRLLDQAVRGSGYLGYSSWRNVPVYDHFQRKLIDNDRIIWNAGDTNLPVNVQKKMKANTQTVELKQMSFVVTSLAENVLEGASIIMVINNDSLDWQKEDLLLIADNQHAELNQIVSLKKMGNNKSVQLLYPLYYSYNFGSYVGGYLDKFYFVGKSGSSYPDKTPVYGLYVYSENGMTEETTDLVSDLHVALENNNHVLNVNMTLMLPHWINGKNYSREQEYRIAFRE